MVDFDAFLEVLKTASYQWLPLAVVLYIISKSIAALRINELYKTIDLKLDNWYNLRLYYVGMFYNHFLPSSIGGDAYKVYLLKEKFKDNPLTKLVGVTLYDRINGLAMLLFLALIFVCFLSIDLPFTWLYILLYAGIVLLFPCFWLFTKLLFSYALKKFAKVSLLSIGVQLVQVVCAFVLLKAFGVTEHYMDYLSLFLVSSVATIIPLTIGGFGAREMVFIYGAQYLPIQEEVAVAVAMSFFGVSLISSFIVGLPYLFTIDR